MATSYTFAAGDVNKGGVYVSWMVEADSEEEAVQTSIDAFTKTVDDPEAIVVGEDDDVPGAFGLIFRVNPDTITADNIIDVG